MILSDVFESFVEDSPISVMARSVLENALTPSAVDALFEDVAERQYTRDLLFSDVVDLMGMVVCKVRPSINAAYQKHAERLGVTRKAVYNKINGVEPPIEPRWSATPRPRWPRSSKRWAGDGSRGWMATVSGSSTAATCPAPSTGSSHCGPSGPAPCRAGVVVLDPELMLVLDAIPCEDGHAQERSMTEEVLAIVRPGDLWVGDRNFCTTSLLFGIAGRGGSFVIRQHASTLSGEAFGSREAEGRCETGAVFGQPVRRAAGMAAPRGAAGHRGVGQAHPGRRPRDPHPDRPARGGGRLGHDRRPLSQEVGLETAFQEIEATLNGEIDALGYPRAVLFALSVRWWLTT